jgi:16S rRNA G966 N2-methylase RsmD
MAVSTLRQNMGKIPPEAQEKIKPLKASFPQCFSVLSRYGPFDLIFLDPPYADRLLPVQFLTFAASQRLAAPGATVIWEQDANFIKNIDPSQFLPWRLTSFRRWGGTGAAFLEFPAQFSPEEQPSEPAEPAIEAET